jgi:hypothetical protein
MEASNISPSGSAEAPAPVAQAGAAPGWKPLYRLGGGAILLAVIVFRRNFGAEMDLFDGFGIFAMPDTLPSSAADWFGLFQVNSLVALILFGLVDLVNLALVSLFFVSLYGALRHAARGWMVVALSAGLGGTVVYFASNQAFAMLSLSQKHAAATTEGQRAIFLAAGEALLAIENPTGIYQGTGVYLTRLLIPLAGLIIAIVMLRSHVFSRLTAVAGILANGLALAYFVPLLVAPSLLWLPMSLSAPFRVLWYFLTARRLFQLGRRNEGQLDQVRPSEA